MNTMNEKPGTAMEIEAQQSSNSAPAYDINEKMGYDRSGAIDAENIERDMTVLQAVKAYPAASWWAFVMSCTIVSIVLKYVLHMIDINNKNRLWNPTASSSWASS